MGINSFSKILSAYGLGIKSMRKIHANGMERMFQATLKNGENGIYSVFKQNGVIRHSLESGAKKVERTIIKGDMSSTFYQKSYNKTVELYPTKTSTYVRDFNKIRYQSDVTKTPLDVRIDKDYYRQTGKVRNKASYLNEIHEDKVYEAAGHGFGPFVKKTDALVYSNGKTSPIFQRPNAFKLNNGSNEMIAKGVFSDRNGQLTMLGGHEDVNTLNKILGTKYQ